MLEEGYPKRSDLTLKYRKISDLLVSLPRLLEGTDISDIKLPTKSLGLVSQIWVTRFQKISELHMDYAVDPLALTNI